MVIYFSGSGNSRYVAQGIALNTNDALVSVNERLKKNDTTDIVCDGSLTVVFPNYCGRMPRVLEEHLKSIKISASKIYFVCTCFQSGWNVEKYCRKLSKSISAEYCGTASVIMPQCYVANYPVLNQADAEKEVLKSNPKIEELSLIISQGKSFSKQKVGVYGKFMSGVMAPVFYPLMVSAKGFKVNDKCTGFGKCQSACSLNNISIKDGKPVWANNCTHCMACINTCPEKAINYKNKTQNRERHIITLSYSKK